MTEIVNKEHPEFAYLNDPKTTLLFHKGQFELSPAKEAYPELEAMIIEYFKDYQSIWLHFDSKGGMYYVAHLCNGEYGCSVTGGLGDQPEQYASHQEALEATAAAYLPEGRPGNWDESETTYLIDGVWFVRTQN